MVAGRVTGVVSGAVAVREAGLALGRVVKVEAAAIAAEVATVMACGPGKPTVTDAARAAETAV